MKTERGIKEEAWTRGKKYAWVSILKECLRQLDYGDPKWSEVALLVEREEAIDSLRLLCVDLGDNDWADDLALSDIISKHVYRYR